MFLPAARALGGSRLARWSSRPRGGCGFSPLRPPLVASAPSSAHAHRVFLSISFSAFITCPQHCGAFLFLVLLLCLPASLLVSGRPGSSYMFVACLLAPSLLLGSLTSSQSNFVGTLPGTLSFHLSAPALSSVWFFYFVSRICLPECRHASRPPPSCGPPLSLLDLPCVTLSVAVPLVVPAWVSSFCFPAVLSAVLIPSGWSPRRLCLPIARALPWSFFSSSMDRLAVVLPVSLLLAPPPIHWNLFRFQLIQPYISLNFQVDHGYYFSLLGCSSSLYPLTHLIYHFALTSVESAQPRRACHPCKTVLLALLTLA